MAGEAVLSAFMQVVFEKTFVAADQEIGLIRGARKELIKLSETLKTIQAVLEDAEDKQIKDIAVGGWLRKLKDVAYDADDLLDDVATKQIQQEIEGLSQQLVICNIFSCTCFTSLIDRRKLAHGVRDIRERLDEIAKERDNLRLRELGDTTRLERIRKLPTSSLVDESTVVGRDEDKNKIVEMLISEPTGSKHFLVLAIVGLGGLGKSTLAQIVYNDIRVNAHFDLCMWVYVSQSYNVSQLTKAIIEAATREEFKLSELNLLQESLRETLKGKRFLLVLDDMWNDDRNKWEQLCLPLAAGGIGSKILVTTRNKQVATTVSTLQPYFLERLDDGACWELFAKFAFASGESFTNPRIKAIGNEILRKLQGLPLAAKTIGSLLYSNYDVNEWWNILQSDIWELQSGKNEILPALRLSYQNLSPHLKQCFAYCSLFPKGHKFDRDKLVKIWIAQGFIQPNGRKRLEDIGAEYFDDLHFRSFFQIDTDGYIMHDMMHALTQTISVGECYIALDDRPVDMPARIRHLSLSFSDSMSEWFSMCSNYKGLRTLIALHGFNSRVVNVPSNLFLEMKFLRVLDFNGCFIRELPDTIGNLKHLRYLDLSGTSLERLPETLTTLYNLQTLKLINCYTLKQLPYGMSTLRQIRHLEADSKLVMSVVGIGKLTSLQKLQIFVVKKTEGFKIAELKHLMELRGKLEIWELENVLTEAEAQEARLNTKQHLRSLELDWSTDRQDEGIDEEVLGGLQPHTNLEELNIDGYNGIRFPSWLGHPSFFGLMKIYLLDCRKCTMLPPLGQLQCLRDLTLHGMHRVRKVAGEFCGYGSVNGFPSLEVLCFEDMLIWEEWSGVENGSFPALQELVIKDCPNLRGLPELLPPLAKLQISNAGIEALPGIYGHGKTYQTNSTA